MERLILLKGERGFPNYLQLSNGCSSENNYCLFLTHLKRSEEVIPTQPQGLKVDTRKRKDRDTQWEAGNRFLIT